MKVLVVIAIAICARPASAGGYSLTRFTIGDNRLPGIPYQNIADMFRSRVEEDFKIQFPMFRAVSARFMEGENSVYAIKVKVADDSSIIMVVGGGQYAPLFLGTKALSKGVSFAGLHVELHTYITERDYY